MIARCNRGRKLPFEVLATTSSGEKAYYLEPGISFPGGSRTVYSTDGEEWMPEFFPGRITLFIPGNPGAGKSYLASEIIESLPDDTEVLLFTALEESDGNFSSFKDRTYRIRMEPDNLGRLTLSEIRARVPYPLLLFDDIDKIRDKEVERKIYALLEDALANGRGHEKHDGKGDIQVIVTSHALNDYRKTKFTLENSEYVALFPGSTTYAQLERLCKKIGISQSLCQYFHEQGKKGVRRIFIHKNTPMYFIAGDEISLL